MSILGSLDAGLLFWLVGAIVVVPSGMLSDWERSAWRRADLPVWGFLARHGVSAAALAADIGEAGVEAATMRCTHCRSHKRCARRLRDGAHSPDAACPNVKLFR